MPSVHLVPEDRAFIERLIRSGTTPQRVVRRARIVLMAGEGLSGRAIAQVLGVSANTVNLWCRRYASGGCATLLTDAPGRGRKSTATAPQHVARVQQLLATTPVSGDRWTVRRIAEACGISRPAAHRILRMLLSNGRRRKP